MDMITLPAGDRVPSLGLGTWHMGVRAGDNRAVHRARLAKWGRNGQ